MSRDLREQNRRSWNAATGVADRAATCTAMPPWRALLSEAEARWIAQALKQVSNEPARIVPSLNDCVDEAEHCRAVIIRHGDHNFVDERRVGDTELIGGLLVRKTFRARSGK